MTTHIFVPGLDDFHRQLLQTLRGSDDYSFHGLLAYDQVVHPSHYPISELLAAARRQLDGFAGQVDAIVGHWDFPTPELIAQLCADYGLRGPSLASVLVAEHKYWCRLVQERAVPECTPAFEGVNPRDDDAADRIALAYPFWLKPNIAFSSQLAFFVGDRAQLDEALAAIRSGIARFGEPFATFCHSATLPAPIPAERDAWWCIAESVIGGEQCTAEGYVYRGEAAVYAIVDSFREGVHGSSFSRYQLPSTLPEAVKARIRDAAVRLVQALGLDDTPFNIEFFWDEDTDRLWLLEVNVRLSKSHSPLFVDVMGASQHEVAVDIALDRQPRLPRFEGRCPMAAKFMLRRHRDAVVTRVPTAQELADLERRYPGAMIQIAVHEGMRLSDLPGQDAYSFEVAVIFLGGENAAALEANYARLIDELPLTFDEGPPAS